MKVKKPSVTEYMKSAPKEAHKMLRELRTLLKKAAPNATEAIKWSTPVFEDKRILFTYAAFKTHISFMPTPSALRPFKKDLEKYKTSKSSVQFPYGKALPKSLITKIAKFRVKEVKEKDARWM